MANASHSAGILVLGMHRSGTSALAHMLQLAGADIGSRVAGAGAGNERGHWEDSFAVELHERLLSRFGVHWDDAFALPRDWAHQEAARSAQQAIEGYLSGSRSQEALWAVKDPRLSLFGPLWRDAAARLQMPLSAIVVARHPLEVADSLAARDGIAVGKALMLWTEHTLSALRIAESMPSVVVAYQQLLSDWRGCAQRIRTLPGAATLDFEANADAIAASLHVGMRHHVHAGDAGLPGLVARIWRHMEALGTDGTVLPGTARDLAHALEELSDLLYPYAEDVRDERGKLWERVARAEGQLSPLLEATVQVPFEMQELRARVDLQQDNIIAAFSTEVRTMQEAYASAAKVAAGAERDAEIARQLGPEISALRSRIEASHESVIEAISVELRRMQEVTASAVLAARESEARAAAEAGNAERSATELAAVRQQLEREASILQLEIARLREMSDRLNYVMGTRSWRWTRPLRVMARLLRGQWNTTDSHRLRRGILELKARAPLVSREYRHKHRVAALRAAEENGPVPHRQADGIALRAAGGQDLPDVFVWAVIDWHFRTQRPQHLARALARKGHRVFYISNNFVDDRAPGFSILPLDDEGSLFQIHLNLPGSPQIYHGMPSASQREALRQGLAELLHWTNTRTAISIVQHPHWMDIASMVPNPRLVYDCMDHHTGFENNASAVLRAEARLVEVADLVVVTSTRLQQEVRGHARSTSIIRNAADYDFFSTRPSVVFRDSQDRRIIGYYGAIAEWFDVALVRAVAERHPEQLVLLIGADTVSAGAALADLANVRFVGEVKYDTLPYWLHAFDVCMLPFKVIPLTIATNPVKVYEYLSAGKPVVSVDLPEMAQFAGLVQVAAEAPAFVEAVSMSLSQMQSAADIEVRQAFAREQTWAHRADLLDAQLKCLPEPRVSVVVLAHDNLEFTQACLFSIEAYSDYGNLEVIVVDNLSSDGSRDWLQTWAAEPSVAGHARKLILNDRNAGFAAGNNIGLRNADGEYVVILNNDTYVTPGWVRSLCAHFKRDPRLGVVGPVTNNIGNEAKLDLQYSSMEEMIRLAGEHTRAHPGGEIPLTTAAFFCVAIPRTVLEVVGELDEAFGLGFFEDDDYCRRVEQAGFRIACAEDVFVHHHLSASFEKLQSEQKRELFERNKRLYEAKWGAWTPHAYRGAKSG